MTENIYIIIGSSNYTNENKLPACKNDVTEIKKLIDASGKFNDGVLIFDKSASETNQTLTDFVRAKKAEGKSIDQLFFYFTGHGDRDTDFQYLLKDYDSIRPKSTSISNETLDEMLKSLNAKLVCKVVDACFANHRYVKGEDDFKSVLKKSISHFNKAYFYFSSASTEVSRADDKISFFTRSFLEAIPSDEGKALLFREISASIADDLELKRYQTPHFVSQCDQTEVFIEVNSEVVTNINNFRTHYIPSPSTSVVMSPTNSTESQSEQSSADAKLLAAIKSIESNYCSEEEAIVSIGILSNTIENHLLPEHLNATHETNLDLIAELQAINGVNKVAKWLDESDEDLFVKIHNVIQSYQATVPVRSGLAGISSLISGETKEVTRTRTVPDYYSHTVDFGFNGTILELEPKGQVLPKFDLAIVFAASKHRLVIFGRRVSYINKTWQQRKISNSSEWVLKKCALKNHDDVRTKCTELLDELIEGVREEIVLTINNSPYLSPKGE